MRDGLAPGAQAQVTIVVTPAMVAEFEELGLVHRVYSTWAMVHHMELACRKVILPYLEPDEEAVGYSVSVTHLAPTPVGMKVTVTARLEQIDGNRWWPGGITRSTGIVLLVVIALLVGMSPLAAAPGGVGEPYKIGFVASVTGPGASLGIPERNVSRIVQDRLTAAGGVVGTDGVHHEVQILVFDDASRADAASGLVRRLIEQERVTILVAGTLSGPSLAMIPIASEARTPMISMASARAIIEDPQTK